MPFQLYHICDKVKSVMIDTRYLFDDIDEYSCAWVRDNTSDAIDLARITDIVIEKNIRIISVPTGIIGQIWPWTENKNIKILGRFDCTGDEAAVSKLSGDMTTEFKSGLSGVQVFVAPKNLSSFVQNLLPIRDDLLFNRYFAIGVDIDNCDNLNWTEYFDTAKKIRPDAILIVAHGDEFNQKSDFAGKIFDMLNNWDLDCELHLMCDNNMLRISQVLRLVDRIMPELLNKFRVFRIAG